MNYALLVSFLLATTIAFGRQLAVVGRVRTALWFFSHFEQKRLFFSISSLSLLLISIYNIGLSGLTISVGALTILLILFAFFFDHFQFSAQLSDIMKSPPLCCYNYSFLFPMRFFRLLGFFFFLLEPQTSFMTIFFVHFRRIRSLSPPI